TRGGHFLCSGRPRRLRWWVLSLVVRSAPFFPLGQDPARDAGQERDQPLTAVRRQGLDLERHAPHPLPAAPSRARRPPAPAPPHRGAPPLNHARTRYVACCSGPRSSRAAIRLSRRYSSGARRTTTSRRSTSRLLPDRSRSDRRPSEQEESRVLERRI